MSILIKGLKMPKKGTCIDIVILGDGTVFCYDEDDKKIGEAVELPDHGDLIDRDKLLKKKMKMDAFVALEWVSDVDICLERTVIPAERGEESLCENCDKRSDVGCSWCKKMEIS